MKSIIVAVVCCKARDLYRQWTTLAKESGAVYKERRMLSDRQER